MRLLKILFCLSIFIPVFSHAHEDHKGVDGNPYEEYGAPIEEKQAREFAMYVVNKLVDDKKLAESWRSVSISKIEKKTFHEELQWVIEYQNPEEPNKDWTTLYIFANEYGEFRGVNFTGK